MIGSVVGARSAAVMPSARMTAAVLPASPEYDSRTVLGLPVEPDVASNNAVSAVNLTGRLTVFRWKIVVPAIGSAAGR